ncbi:putative phycocyanin operon protein Z [Gracilariopsis chorda]|uniref:Putative phycocyanin operon protein Z n=1 Tax=Gracilariopsis chorda TaxID=448386 RepID=A0A2V3IGL0_9FLOR|nr:putative phycocyanin operon protein Z [Gracilariopsis chorda]|eukprot:PXF41235.1 putative phycocyanin operon protein Z [Gracilariopsis chorda]
MAPPALFVTPVTPVAPVALPRRSSHAARNRSVRRPPPTCTADDLFSRLSHVNPNLRKKASYQLSERATPQIITRLISELSVEDVAHRRAAVQALSMTGLPALQPVLHQLDTTDNVTVRASCAKVLSGIALYFPDARQTFPQAAFNSLQTALQHGDPVTKLATIGCLATMGSDFKEGGQVTANGNASAVQILFSLCTASSDMVVAATAAGALAQIAQNGTPETKQHVIDHFQSLTASPEADDEPGFNYVREMVSSHLEQLKSKSVVSDRE